MNPIVRASLEVGKAIAPLVFPPSGPAIAAVDRIIHHQGDVTENIADTGQAAIKVIEGIKGTDIADEAKFRAGVVLIEQGYKLVHDSLKVSGS